MFTSLFSKLRPRVRPDIYVLPFLVILLVSCVSSATMESIPTINISEDPQVKDLLLITAEINQIIGNDSED